MTYVHETVKLKTIESTYQKWYSPGKRRQKLATSINWFLIDKPHSPTVKRMMKHFHNKIYQETQQS